MHQPRRTSLAFVLAFLCVLPTLVAACGRAKGVTEVCDGSDECAAGLTCLGLMNSTGSSCELAGNACTTSCATDADCAPLGSGLTCLSQCDSTKICGRLVTP